MIDHFLFSDDYIHKIKLEYISHTRLVNLSHKKTKYSCLDYYTLHLSSHGQKYEFNIRFVKNKEEQNWGYGIETVDKFTIHPKITETNGCFVEQKYKKIFEFINVEEKYMPLIDDIVVSSNIFYLNPYNSSFNNFLFVTDVEECKYEDLLDELLEVNNYSDFFETMLNKLN